MAVPDHHIAVHDDRFGTPIEKRVDILEKSSDSQNSNGEEKSMKVTVDTEEGDGAQRKSSIGRRVVRKLRPNRILIHVTIWLLVTT